MDEAAVTTAGGTPLLADPFGANIDKAFLMFPSSLKEFAPSGGGAIGLR